MTEQWPLNGADAVEQPRPFRVQVKDIEGPSWWIDIPRAYGRLDAANQAREVVRDEGEDVRVIEVKAA